MINPRRLAAVDLVFLGPTLIIGEFALAVVGAPVLGALTLARAGVVWQKLLGVYLVALGINYVPLLIHAIALVRTRAARLVIADESANTRELFRKYRRQSLWLLVPLVAPVAALIVRRRRSIPPDGSETFAVPRRR